MMQGRSSALNATHDIAIRIAPDDELLKVLDSVPEKSDEKAMAKAS